MLEGIICPTCEATLEEVDIKESLTCRHCKTDLKDRKYLDFLEYLMANGLVEDLDFLIKKSIVKMSKGLSLMMKRMSILMILRKRKISLVFMRPRWRFINKRLKMKR